MVGMSILETPKNNLLDSFDKNKVKCEGCGKYFELKLVSRNFLYVISSKSFRDYWKMPHDIKICSYLCWEAYMKDKGVLIDLD